MTVRYVDGSCGRPLSAGDRAEIEKRPSGPVTAVGAGMCRPPSRNGTSLPSARVAWHIKLPARVTEAPGTGFPSGPTTVPTIGGGWGSSFFFSGLSGSSATSYVTSARRP